VVYLNFIKYALIAFVIAFVMPLVFKLGKR
jgi:hypothetical protein